MRITLKDRLLRDVERCGECLIFRPGRKRKRGMIQVGKRQELAYRVSYRIFCGEIPDGLLVCHKCDTPRCIEPSHLFLGTVADNTADMVAKGRGSKPPIKRTSVSPETVAKVDGMRAAGMNYVQIGALLSMSKTQARRIHLRRLVTLCAQ